MTEPNFHFDPADNESWKSEVASRLDSYRNKSKRKLAGEFSMRFNFDGEVVGPRQQICTPALPLDESDEEVEPEMVAQEESQADPQSTEQPAEEQLELEQIAPAPPAPNPPLRPSVPFKRKVVMEANVIEFPRLFPPEPPGRYMLAEPVLSASPPRILDAPEIAQPLLETPILDGMRLEPIAETPSPAFELPLQVAPVRQRLYASACDGLIVLLASMVFSGILYKMLADAIWTKPLVGMVAVTPALFWAFYQVLFIVYGARTPGMAMAHIAFSTFQGTAPNRSERRRRLWGMALSCFSLMLGFLWAFFDEDTLCWHDRISRTYTFQERS